MAGVFTADVWLGSYFELALELGPRSDELLLAALNRLWSHPALDGPYVDHGLEPDEQERLSPVESISRIVHQAYGLATLADGNRLPCSSITVREEDGPDWLDLAIPFGALETVYPVYDEPRPDDWGDELTDWFADIGRFVYAAVPFALGLIGEEVSGRHYAEHIVEHGIPEAHCAMLVPGERGELRWLPLTR